MYTTIALIIFVIESALPSLVPIPGIKLGLANIVTLWLLLSANFKDTFLVLLMRIILGSIYAGQIVYFAYSFSGGILCLIAMFVVHKILGKENIMITSIVGAIFHNVGQLLMAFFLLQSVSVFSYFPVLMVSSIITGSFTGLCTKLTYKRIGKLIL